MQPKYKIKEESYYTYNGCSCCEPDLWTCWSEESTGISMSSLEDVLIELLRLNGVEVEIEWEEN